MSGIDGILDLVQRRGGEMYGGEAVTQLQHALQCATLAQDAGSSDALVTAALLHDIGHMVAEDEGAAQSGHDMYHEEVAANFLAQFFVADVTEPIRLHVPAKRYLCAVDPVYFALLSPASVASLKVQGGVMSPEEAAAFEENPHYRAAVELRRWDDQAKNPELQTDGLERFRLRVMAASRTEGAGA